MLDDIISLYEYIRPLLHYVGVNASDDKLDDKAVRDITLIIEDTEKANYVEGTKNFKPEVKKYSEGKESERNLKEELSRVAIEHTYASTDKDTDENNNEPSSNYPNGNYNLRVRTGNRFNRGCTCCNDR